MEEKEFVCPQCHSDHVQSYELIYSQNVSTSSHMTTGVSLTSNGGIGTGLINTKGVSVTALGETVAPPIPMEVRRELGWKWGLGAIIALIVAISSSSVIGTLVGIAAFCGIWYHHYKVNKEREKWNKEVYPGLLEEWKCSYMCMKCGHRFTL